MRHLLLVLLVGCGASSNPPGPPAPPAPVPPRAPTAAASTPPAPSLPVNPGASAEVVNCAAADQAAEYCAHVKNRCCGDYQTWVCDNAIYVDWFAQQCKQR